MTIHLVRNFTEKWKKETARHKAHHTNTAEAWARYRKLLNSLQTLVSKKHKQSIQVISNELSINSKRFWGPVKAKCQSKCIPTRLNLENNTASSAIDKANFFNNFFNSSFTQSVSDEVYRTTEVFANPLLSDLEPSGAEFIWYWAL